MEQHLMSLRTKNDNLCNIFAQMNSDPFETTLKTLLEERKTVAQRIIDHRQKYDSDVSRLPFEINKTHRLLKQAEYDRKKKSLKQHTDIVQ